MTSTPARDYIAGVPVWHYPGAGDALPPGGAKCLLLTEGGICVTGTWRPDGGFIAWSPMPKRSKLKEALLCQ